MATVKVKRDGQEINVEEQDILETDERITDSGQKGISFTPEQQAHVGFLIGQARNSVRESFKKEKELLEARLAEYEAKEQQRENELQEKLNELKKTAPPELLELIEDAPLEKQIRLIEKHNSNLPILPKPPKEAGNGKSKQTKALANWS